MTTSKFVSLLAFALAAGFTGCTIARNSAPPLQGPSELGLSFTLFANPDTLSQDGASQSQITIRGFDPNGQPAKNIALRAETVDSAGVVLDLGTLSTKNLTTGNDGSAVLTYTAPPAPLVPPTNGSGQVVSIRITPVSRDSGNPLVSGDFGDAQGRIVKLHLVPPGVITGPGPTPSFTVSPASPSAFVQATFTSTSTPPAGASIASTSWDFGDGSTGVGNPILHTFNSAGIFKVSLTVMDSNGASTTGPQFVTVSPGAVPTASFQVTPSSPIVGQTAVYDASGSTAGSGHQLVRWDWDFEGVQTSGQVITYAWPIGTTVGPHLVTLTVTDEVGQTKVLTKAVTLQ
jgi:PKD repeat protein